MLYIAICDDQNLFATVLKENMELISARLHISLNIEIYNSGLALLEKQDKNNAFDAIFLDIDMPEISGMDTAQRLFEKDKYQLIVFITSHDELVFDALKLQPLNFIRKKTYMQDLPAVMQSIADKSDQSEQIHSFMYNGNPIRIKLNDIVYISSYKHTITANCLEEKSFNITSTMQNLENELSSFGFIKANSGCIVNMKYVQTIESDGIILDDGKNIAVSRHQITSVKEKFRLYLR